MFISGVGRTKFGPLAESLPQLLYEAVSKALEDAGIGYEDLDAAYVANFCAGPFVGQLHMNSLLASLLPGTHLPIVRVETACASGASALFQAGLALSRFRTVLVAGVEKMSTVQGSLAATNIGMAGDAELDGPAGLIFPASYALIASAHMAEHGSTLDDLSLVSLKNHENASLNPLAHFYHKRVTLEDINSSATVCSPLRLFDCSPISDGAAALVVSAERRSDREVRVVGSALATDTLSLAERDTITSFAAVRLAAAQAYRQAGIGPKDVDVVEAHDCFTIMELIALEDLGFCEPGEGKDLVREGRTSREGDIPVNVDGGLKADGHPIGASGIAQIFELVTQLRGEAGPRQIPGARIGLAHSVGGVGGTSAVHILRKDN